MTRVATWILGSISGVLLFLGIWVLTVFGAGYGSSGGCVSMNNQPCTPVVQQVTVSLPSLSGPQTFPFFIIALAVLIGLPAWIATPLLALRRGSSARTAIIVVAVISTALLLVFAALIPTANSAVFHAPQVCVSAAGEATFDSSMLAPNCYTGSQAFWIALVGIAWAPLTMALLAGAPAWVMTLTQTARRGQWGWFAAVFFLSPVAALLYALLGDRRPAQPAPVGPAAPIAPASSAPAAG